MSRSHRSGSPLPAPASRWRVSGVPAVLLGLLGACSGADPVALPDVVLGERPPVILIVVDTLRADRLGCYGYELDTSPRVDDWARGAYLFERNSTQCNSTFPAMTSIFTGLYPRTHRNYVPVPLEGSAEPNRAYTSLAERLHEVGYRTIAVVSHPFFDDQPADTALRRGWDVFDTIPTERSVPERLALANAGFTNERALERLDEYERGDEAPLFLWVHYYDPHTPYDPPAEFRDRFLAHHLERIGEGELAGELAAVPPVERFDWLAARFSGERAERLQLAVGGALYDGEVAATDAGVGALFERLERMGLLDRALVAFLADHGENLDGEDSGHGRIAFTHRRLYEGVTGTPLVVRLPGQSSGVRSSALTQNIDVLPTVVELLGLAPGPAVEGRSLVPLLRAPDAVLHEEVFVESSDHVEKAIKTAEWKYIEPEPGLPPEVFRWSEDPGERDDVAKEMDAEVRASLASRLREFRPEDRLALRVLPAAEPFDVSVELALVGSRVARHEGPGRLEEDGRRFVLEQEVRGEEVRVALELETREAAYRWRVRATGDAPVQRRVFLGRTPLDRSSAFPAWVQDPGRAVPDPVLEGAAHPGRAVVTLAVAPPAGDETVVELRFADDRAGEEFRLLEVEGFTPEREIRGFLRQGRTHRLLGPEDGTARAVVTYFPVGAEPVVRATFGGRWPDPARVRWDGAGVRSDELGFVLPRPLGGWTTAALLDVPDEGELPAGSIALSFEGGAVPATLDTAGLSEDDVELLRALGYAR